MKKLTDITLQDLGYVSAACLLAATITACGGGTTTGDGSGDNGGGGQPLITDTTTDTDLDGLPDSLEESIGTDINLADSDGDGVSDGDEWNTYFTDPLNADSDNDGSPDGDEIAAGGNPNDASDGVPDSGDNTNNPRWDQHSNLEKHAEHAFNTDKPVAALLADLKQRGMLEDTLVWWGGEFGRTPYAQDNGTGRDHNPDGFTLFLAGGV